MLARNSVEKRFGYLKLESIDMEKWRRNYMDDSNWNSFLWLITYVVANYLTAIMLLAHLVFDLLALAFCLPYIGIGERLMPIVSAFEYGIPVGPVRWIFCIVLLGLLIMKFIHNFIYKGIQLQRDITLGEVMRNRYARRMICLKSYSRWRLFKYLMYQCSTEEYVISWIIYCNDEWKRYLVLKPIIFLVACLQLSEMTSHYYISPNSTIHLLALIYWISKVLLFLNESLVKIGGLLVYIFYVRTFDEIENGCTVTDYWQNKVIEMAAPFISMKNPFLEPPPADVATNETAELKLKTTFTNQNSNIGERDTFYKMGSIQDSFFEENDYETVERADLPSPTALVEQPEDRDLDAPWQAQKSRLDELTRISQEKVNNHQTSPRLGRRGSRSLSDLRDSFVDGTRPVSNADTEITWIRPFAVNKNEKSVVLSHYQAPQWSKSASFFSEFDGPTTNRDHKENGGV